MNRIQLSAPVIAALALAACRPTSETARSSAPPQQQQAQSQPFGCVVRDADSARIASVAIAVTNANQGVTADVLNLRVSEFERGRDGTLVTVLPEQIVIGGGARVWVPNGGCAVVRERIE